jgi:hypothetical protein
VERARNCSRLESTPTTSWSIVNSCTDELVVCGSFAFYNETYYESAFEYCLDEMYRYKFVIRNSSGDGGGSVRGKNDYSAVMMKSRWQERIRSLEVLV